MTDPSASTQENIYSRKGATYLGIESTFNTLATTERCFPLHDATVFTTNKEVLPINDQRTRLWDYNTPAKGLLSCEVTLGFQIKPPGTQLGLLATPTTPYLGLLLKALLGGEASAAGFKQKTGSDATKITLDAGGGVAFPEGSWMAYVVGTAYEVGKSTKVATDVITLFPSPSSTPAIADEVAYNGYCYYLTETNTQSLSVQHAYVDSSTTHRWDFRGLTGNFELGLERGKIPTITAKLKGATWAKPGTSVSVAAASDTMAAPFVLRNNTLWVQQSSVLTRTHYPVESLALKLSEVNQHVTELGGTAEGIIGVRRAAPEFAYEVTWKQRADPNLSGFYDSSTPFAAVLVVPVGASNFLIIDMPKLVIVGHPQVEKFANGFLYETVTARGQMDSSGFVGTSALATSPLRIVLI